MEKLFKALLLGSAAGIINAIPMVFNNAGLRITVAAFFYWLAMGVIITYVKAPLSGWLSGMLLAVVTAMPMIILSSTTDLTAWIPLLLGAIILGSVLGLAAEKLILDAE